MSAWSHLACSTLLAASLFGHCAHLAVLSELCHQVLSIARHSALAQSAVQNLWLRLSGCPPDTLAFGPVRLSLLIRLAATVCAGGVALFIALEALLDLAWLSTDSSHAEVPLLAAAAALATCLAEWAGANAHEQRSIIGSRVAPANFARLRAAVLVAAVVTNRANRLSWSLWAAEFMPPLVRFAMALMLRNPDAAAASLLAALAVGRSCSEASLPARILLQAAPQMPEVEQRLARARAVPGVLHIREVQLWALDETSAVCSLVVRVGMDSDAQAVLRDVRGAFESTPMLAHLTVQVEQDDVDDIQIDSAGRIDDYGSDGGIRWKGLKHV